METTSSGLGYWGYIGIMMETTIMGYIANIVVI